MGGRADTAIGWARDAYAIAMANGDSGARLAAIGGMLVATVFTGGDDREAWAMFEAGITLSEATESWWVLGMSAGFAGATISAYDPEVGLALVERAEDAARRSGAPYIIGAVAMAHGRLLGRSGQTEAAAERFGVASARFAEIGDVRLGLAARSDLAHAYRRGGQLDRAEAMYRETIGGWVHLGHRGAVANQLENVAYVAIERGDGPRAARLLGAAEAIREAAHAAMAFDERPELDGFVGRLRDLLPAAELDAAWAEGRSMSQAAAVALVISGGTTAEGQAVGL
jgi:hypothetical protein